MKKLNVLLFLLIFCTFILAGFLFSQFTGKAVVNSKIEHANLTYVIDGDTIETNLGKVRLLGINTPEKKHLGYQEPKDYLKQFEGQQVELEKTIENKDQYSRLLRYVFLGNHFLNKEILENGWAHFYSYNEDKYAQDLLKAEKNARNQQLGIWEKSKDICSACIFLVKLNEVDPGEFVIFGNKCEINCSLNRWLVNDDSSSHERKLDFVIPAGSQIRIDYNGSIWNDDGDSLYLRDSSGLLVVFYRY